MFNILSQQLYHLIIDYFWEDYTAETMALVRLSLRASGTYSAQTNHRRQIEAHPRDLTSEAQTLSTKPQQIDFVLCCAFVHIVNIK